MKHALNYTQKIDARKEFK